MPSTTDTVHRISPCAVASLVVLASIASGTRCPQGTERAEPERPLPPLVDSSGAVDARAFEALVTRIEDRRGLRFVRRPTLALVAPDDERLAARAAEDRRGCAGDLEHALVLCAPPLDAGAVATVLARLIDAQHYPALVRAAPDLPGDPGRAIRALLEASVRATTTTGLGPLVPELPPGVLDQERIEIESSEDPGSFLLVAALGFLRVQRDREAPFRDPPLSTRQILNPRDYRDGIRPVVLAGEPPSPAGCEPASDESVGPAALLGAAAGSGGAVPGRALAGWRGDRRVELACADGTRPWVYAADFDDATGAAAFAAHLADFLPGPAPMESLLAGRRVLAWHGLPRGRVLAWANGLRARELRGLDMLHEAAVGPLRRIHDPPGQTIAASIPASSKGPGWPTQERAAGAVYTTRTARDLRPR